MANTITITCPECESQLKAPAEVAGKKIRCKGCGATFAAKASSEKPRATPGASKASSKAPAKSEKPAAKAVKPAAKPAKKEEVDPFAPDNVAFGLKEEYLGRRCPDCANAMEEEDRICLHCGYDTVTRVKAHTRLIQDITGLDIFLWLLPGILCAIVALTLLTACTVMWIFINRETFGEVWYDFLGALGTKVYASVVSLYIIYKCGRFAIIRLCIKNKPPEIEVKGEGNER